VVDDSIDNAESLAMLLRLQGHEVRVAQDGEAALQSADSDRPFLVFLDLNLPDMDGYEVASRLRKKPGMDDTVIVALSGQEEDPDRAHAAGFNQHLVKPVDIPSLKRLVSSAAHTVH
jgi:two-component system CheB/CheR fusion protein